MARTGGKKLLREKIIDKFPEQIGRYIEVFGGAGWVLFARDKHAPIEVFNDADSELINLFRVIKCHPEALQKELEWVLNSRELFALCTIPMPLGALTDIQRAARQYILIKESFGADTRTYGGKFQNLHKAIDYLAQISQRLDAVTIEHKDFFNLIKVYDRPDALFYCDPPYHGTEKYYSEIFTEDDHKRLKEVLSNIKGRFILSYNNDNFIKKLYQGYHIEEVSRSNNLSPGKQFGELIICNY